MRFIITPEQFEEYRTRVLVNDADYEGYFWLGYSFYEHTGGMDYDPRIAHDVWQQAIRRIGNTNSNQDGTGKIRFLLAELVSWEGDHVLAHQLHHQAVSRLLWEASQGDPHSQYYAGCTLTYGHPHVDYLTVVTDAVQGAIWFERSAEQGLIESMLSIARMYSEGMGVKQDLVKAVDYYDKAIAKGCEESSRKRQSLLMKLAGPERERVLGCVQRNTWIKNVQQTATLAPSLGVLTRALEKVAGCPNKWASLSSTFLCLKEMIAFSPKVNEDLRVRTKKRKCF